jgi:hypothetical protein
MPTVRHLWIFLGLGFFALLACPSRRQAPVDAGTPLDAGPPVDAGVSYQIRALIPDAGEVAVVAEEGSFALVDSTSELYLHAAPALVDYRVRLFDETHRALVSDDEADAADGGIAYRIRLATPLKSGHKYTLVVDGQTGTDIIDVSGKIHPEYRFPIQISGEKVKEPPPPPKKRRRSR